MGDTSPAGGTNVEGESPQVEATIETDEATITDDAELERTLGLSGWPRHRDRDDDRCRHFRLSRGSGRRGRSRSGGVVRHRRARRVAGRTADLRTRDGDAQKRGGYYYISRALGTLAGTVVGLSLWFGLVFATAFYLVGFGYYAVDTLAELGVCGRRWARYPAGCCCSARALPY